MYLGIPKECIVGYPVKCPVSMSGCLSVILQVSMDIKRGNPDQPSDYVDFKDFLQMYNNSKRRMVEFTPEFLK